MAPYISPTTMPTSAWPRPSRSPVSSSGTEEGSATVRNICRSLAPNERATLTKSAWSVRTPVMVFTRIGKMAPRKTIAIFDMRPIPNQIMSSGSSAMRGVA